MGLPGYHSTTRWLLQLSFWDPNYNKLHGKHAAQEPGVEQTPEQTRFCSASPRNHSMMVPCSVPNRSIFEGLHPGLSSSVVGCDQISLAGGRVSL